MSEQIESRAGEDRPLGAGGSRAWAGGLRVGDAGNQVTVMGWVAVRRDLGGLIFIDLRDRSGIVQVVFDPESAPEAHAAAKELRAEWVVRIDGEVRRREEENVNAELPTGEVEIRAAALEVLNRSETPPFELSEAEKAHEDLRLRHRYIDLRRPELFGNFLLRDAVIQAGRATLHELGFLEVETPILIRSTPEGARDYLVPSRVHRGAFYALPQSPQILKQVLMVSGFEKYYQIARCFRDEDLRADRQPEFTQLDLEASFVEEEDVFEVVERVMAAMWRRAGEELETPFPRLSYEECMDRYGTDKPDVRFAMEITSLEEEVAGGGFKVFTSIIEGGGTVRGLGVPDAAEASRSELDAWEEAAKEKGAKGLVWIKKTEDGYASPVLKHLGEEAAAAVFERLGIGTGGVALLVAGEVDMVRRCLGHLRNRLAKERGLVPEGRWAPLWVYPFPLFERAEEGERWEALHHPFCAPFPEEVERLEEEPGALRGRTYDLVLNGFELGTGSIRIHDPDLQERVFRLLGIGREEARERFGFLLEALTYGAPPHGGIALGLDRIVMLLARAASLREVIAFPKTTSAQCLMTGAPAPVGDDQLHGLGIERREDRPKTPEPETPAE